MEDHKKRRKRNIIYYTLSALMIIFSISLSAMRISKHYSDEKERFRIIEEKLANVNDLELLGVLDIVTIKNGEVEMAIRDNFFYPAIKTKPDSKFPIKDFYYDKKNTTLRFNVISKENSEVKYEWAFVPSSEKFKTKIVDITNNKAHYDIIYRPEDIGLKRDVFFTFFDYNDDDIVDMTYFEKHMNSQVDLAKENKKKEK